MEQRACCEDYTSSASQDIPFILRQAEARYSTHKDPLPVSVQNQINPVHDSISLFEDRFYYYPSSTLTFSKSPFPLRVNHQNLTLL
jgi:hypothetical protein